MFNLINEQSDLRCFYQLSLLKSHLSLRWKCDFLPISFSEIPLYACMIPFVCRSSNRAKNEKVVVRAYGDLCFYDLISSRRLALLHRLTRFLLLLSIIIVASHCALLHFLLKPSSSILTRFRFSSFSTIIFCFFASFIHLFIEQNWNDNTVGNRMKRADIRKLENNVCTSSTTLILVISFSLSLVFFSRSLSLHFCVASIHTFFSQVFAHLDLIS